MHLLLSNICGMTGAVFFFFSQECSFILTVSFPYINLNLVVMDAYTIAVELHHNRLMGATLLHQKQKSVKGKIRLFPFLKEFF